MEVICTMAKWHPIAGVTVVEAQHAGVDTGSISGRQLRRLTTQRTSLFSVIEYPMCIFHQSFTMKLAARWMMQQVCHSTHTVLGAWIYTPNEMFTSPATSSPPIHPPPTHCVQQHEQMFEPVMIIVYHNLLNSSPSTRGKRWRVDCKLSKHSACEWLCQRLWGGVNRQPDIVARASALPHPVSVASVMDTPTCAPWSWVVSSKRWRSWWRTDASPDRVKQARHLNDTRNWLLRILSSRSLFIYELIP